MINISEKDRTIITDICRRYIPCCEVRALGSRVCGTAKKFSDLDIVVMSDKKIDRRIIGKLKEAFQAAPLNFRVDVAEWYTLSAEFRAIIEEKNEILVAQQGTGK